MWLRDHSVKKAQDAFSTEHILDTLKSSFKFPSLHVFISSPFLSGCFFLCHFSTIPSCVNVSHVFKRSSILHPLELSSMLMSEGSHPFLWIPVVFHLHNSTNLSSPSESPTPYRQSKSFVQWVNKHHTEKKYSHSRTICLLFLSSYMRCDWHGDILPHILSPGTFKDAVWRKYSHLWYLFILLFTIKSLFFNSFLS